MWQVWFNLTQMLCYKYALKFATFNYLYICIETFRTAIYHLRYYITMELLNPVFTFGAVTT